MLIDDVSLRPLLAYGNIIHDSRGRAWDPRLHPRGHDGKFIRTGGHVKILGNLDNVIGTGTVRGILPDGRIWVDPTGGGAPQFVRPAKINSIEYKATLANNINVNRPDRNGARIGVGDSVYLPNNEIGKVTNTGNGVFQVTKTDGSVINAKPQRLRAVTPVKDAEPKANLSLLDHSGTRVGDFQATTKDVKPAARKLGKTARTSGQSLLNVKNGDTVEGIAVHVPGNEQTFKGDRITVKNLRAYLANNKDVLNGADPRVHLSAVVTTNPDGSKSITLSTPRVYGKNELAAALADAQAHNGTLTSVHNNTSLDAHPRPGESHDQHIARLNGILAGSAHPAPNGPNAVSPVGTNAHPGTGRQGFDRSNPLAPPAEHRVPTPTSEPAQSSAPATPAPVEPNVPAEPAVTYDSFNQHTAGLDTLRKVSADINSRPNQTRDEQRAAALLDGLIGAEVDSREKSKGYNAAAFDEHIKQYIVAAVTDGSLHPIDVSGKLESALLNLVDNPGRDSKGNPILRRADLPGANVPAAPKASINDVKRSADRAKLDAATPSVPAAPATPATPAVPHEPAPPIDLNPDHSILSAPAFLDHAAAVEADKLGAAELSNIDHSLSTIESILPEGETKQVARRAGQWIRENQHGFADGDIRVLVEDLKDLARTQQDRINNGDVNAKDVQFIAERISALRDAQRGLVNLNGGDFTLQDNFKNLTDWANRNGDQGVIDAVARLQEAASAHSLGAPAADVRVGKHVNLDAPQRIATLNTALETLKNSRGDAVGKQEITDVQGVLTRLGQTVQDVQMANQLLADIKRGTNDGSRSKYDFQGIAKMLQGAVNSKDVPDGSKIRAQQSLTHMLSAVHAAESTDLSNPETRMATLGAVNKALHDANMELGSYQNINGKTTFVPGQGLETAAFAVASMRLDFQRGLGRYIGNEAFIRPEQKQALSHVMFIKDPRTGELIQRQPHGTNMRLWRRKRESRYDDHQVSIGGQNYALGDWVKDSAGNPAQVVRLEPRGQHRYGRNEGVRLSLESYNQQGLLTKSIITVNERNAQNTYPHIRPADFASPEDLKNTLDVQIGQLNEATGGFSPKALMAQGWSLDKARNIQSANASGLDARSVLRGWDKSPDAKLSALFNTSEVHGDIGSHSVTHSTDGKSFTLTVKDHGGAASSLTVQHRMDNLYTASFHGEPGMSPALKAKVYERFHDWAVANHVTSINITGGTFDGKHMAQLGFDWNFSNPNERKAVAQNLLNELQKAHDNPPDGIKAEDISPFITHMNALFEAKGANGVIGNRDIPPPQAIYQAGLGDVLNKVGWKSGMDPVIPDHILAKMNVPAMMARRQQVFQGFNNRPIAHVDAPRPRNVNLVAPPQLSDAVPSAGRESALNVADIAHNDPAVLSLAKNENVSPAELAGDESIAQNLQQFISGNLLQGTPEYKQAVNTLRGRAAHAQTTMTDPQESSNMLGVMDRLAAKNTLSPEHQALIAPLKDTITVESIHKDGPPAGWQRTEREKTYNINEVVRLQHTDTGLVLFVKKNNYSGFKGTQMNKGEVEGSRSYIAMGAPIGEQYYGNGDTTFSVDLPIASGVANISHPNAEPNQTQRGLEISPSQWHNPADVVTQVLGAGLLQDVDHHPKNLMTAQDALGAHLIFMDFGLSLPAMEQKGDAAVKISPVQAMQYQRGAFMAASGAAKNYTPAALENLKNYRLAQLEAYVNSHQSGFSQGMKDILLRRLQSMRAADLSTLFK